ncbi:MAG: TonB-dependent receptor [Planctomycetota bacterium]
MACPPTPNPSASPRLTPPFLVACAALATASTASTADASREAFRALGTESLASVETAAAAPSALAPATPSAPQDPSARPSAPPQDPARPDAPSPGSAAPAQEPQTATLETLVITAERGVPLTYAGGRDVLEPDVLETYPEASPSTVLRRLPGVFVMPENGNDSRIHVGLRGNDPRRSALTAVLVDGIPVCEAPYGNTDIDGLPIAFERIWRTDVIRGGASIRYGPNSAGGIVNFLTEPVPERSLLRFGARAGTDGDWGGSIAAGGTYGSVGVLATQVAKGGEGFRENGTYRDYDGAVKFRFALDDGGELSAYVSRFVEPHAEQPGGLTQAAYDADPKQTLRPGSDFNFDMNRYVLGYASAPDADRSFQLKFWYQDGTRVLNDFRPVVGPFTVTRQQFSEFDAGALEGTYAWKARAFGVEHSFTHSARFLRETNDELYTRAPIGGGPVITPHELDALFEGRAFSVFNEDVMALTPELDWGVGLRLESIAMYGRSNETGDELVQDYNEVLPATNLTWRVRDETALYASFQQSFYPPQYETGFDPASVLYAPTKAEHSDAFEVGVRSREVEGLEASLALFDTEFHDKIDFINTPDGKVPINTGHARARGVELGLAWDVGTAVDALEGFSLYGSLTAQRSRIEVGANDGNDTPNAPHLLASFGAEYDHVRSGLWARVGGSYTGSAYKDPANTPVGTADGINGPEPAFTLWDGAIGWRQNEDRTGLSISAGVTNLFDEEYFRRFATGIYPGAPRQAFLALTYTLAF